MYNAPLTDIKEIRVHPLKCSKNIVGMQIFAVYIMNGYETLVRIKCKPDFGYSEMRNSLREMIPCFNAYDHGFGNLVSS